MNVTIVDNEAVDVGGGIGSANAGVVRLVNVVLGRNSLNGEAADCGTVDGGAVVSEGRNLSEDAICAALTRASDRTETGAGLAETACDNGGSTPTHALLEESAAIDAGDATRCPATDQRGYARLGSCDIGAFEYGAGPAAAGRASPARRAVR